MEHAYAHFDTSIAFFMVKKLKLNQGL